jgi:hypothetical protein
MYAKQVVRCGSHKRHTRLKSYDCCICNNNTGFAVGLGVFKKNIVWSERTSLEPILRLLNLHPHR